MKKRTAYQNWILSRARETDSAVVRYDKLFQSHGIVDGSYQEVIRGDSFRLILGEFVQVRESAQFIDYRPKGK